MMEVYIGLIVITAVISLITGYSFGKTAGAKMVLKNSDIVNEVLNEVLKERSSKND